MGIDPLTIGAIATVGSAVASVGGHIYGAERAASSNERINESNERLQREINAQNEALMREAWNRDDSAVRRRAMDLKLAGLSKTLAAGSSAAASSPIKVEAPKMEQTDNAWAGAGAGLGKALAGAPMQAMQFASMEAQRELTKSMVMTESSKRASLAAKAANDLSTAGFKKEAARITKKDADLWTQQGVDVRNRDAFSRAVNSVPGIVERVKSEVARSDIKDYKKGGNILNQLGLPVPYSKE